MMRRPTIQQYHQEPGWEDPDIVQIHHGHQEKIQHSPESGNTGQKVYLTTLGKDQTRRDPSTPILQMEEVEMMMGMMMGTMVMIRTTYQYQGGQSIEGETKDLTHKTFTSKTAPSNSLNPRVSLDQNRK